MFVEVLLVMDTSPLVVLLTDVSPDITELPSWRWILFPEIIVPSVVFVISNDALVIAIELMSKEKACVSVEHILTSI